MGHVTLPISGSHVTHLNESCHTLTRSLSFSDKDASGSDLEITSDIGESCHTSEWVVSHIWMGHVTHLNGSCHTSEWVVSHSQIQTLVKWWRCFGGALFCCRVLQGVAGCCRVLQGVAGCCRVLQCAVARWHRTTMGWLRLVGSLKS